MSNKAAKTVEQLAKKIAADSATLRRDMMHWRKRRSERRKTAGVLALGKKTLHGAHTRLGVTQGSAAKERSPLLTTPERRELRGLAHRRQTLARLLGAHTTAVARSKGVSDQKLRRYKTMHEAAAKVIRAWETPLKRNTRKKNRIFDPVSLKDYHQGLPKYQDETRRANRENRDARMRAVAEELVAEEEKPVAVAQAVAIQPAINTTEEERQQEAIKEEVRRARKEKLDAAEEAWTQAVVESPTDEQEVARLENLIGQLHTQPPTDREVIEARLRLLDLSPHSQAEWNPDVHSPSALVGMEVSPVRPEEEDGLLAELRAMEEEDELLAELEALENDLSPGALRELDSLEKNYNPDGTRKKGRGGRRRKKRKTRKKRKKRKTRKRKYRHHKRRTSYRKRRRSTSRKIY